MRVWRLGSSERFGSRSLGSSGSSSSLDLLEYQVPVTLLFRVGMGPVWLGPLGLRAWRVSSIYMCIYIYMYCERERERERERATYTRFGFLSAMWVKGSRCDQQHDHQNDHLPEILKQ